MFNNNTALPSKSITLMKFQTPDTVPQIMKEKNLLNGHLVLCCFGQSRLQREKNPNCHKYATFEGSFFYVFMYKKKLLKFG